MTHVLRIHEHGKFSTPYIQIYEQTEMVEMFTEEQRLLLANGEAIITRPDRFGKQSTIVDLEAHFLKNNRFGITQ